MREKILKPLPQMSEDELIEVLTKDREDYNDEMLNKVTSELEKRGISLEDVKNRVTFWINASDPEKANIESALAKLDEEIEITDVLYFENYMSEIIAIQKAEKFYGAHHFNKKRNSQTFFINEDKDIKEFLKRFLRMEDWNSFVENSYEHWDTFIESHSAKYISNVAELLDGIGIYYSINSQNLIRFRTFSKPFALVVPVEFLDKAETVLDKLDDKKDKLYEELEKAEEASDIEKELEILRELEGITPEDPAVFYNKAQILAEKGEHKEASDAVIDSFNIELENGDVEDLVEIEKYLMEALPKVDDKKNILHCLASIASFKGENERAFELYKNLIKEDESDSVAHLNLGHLYFSQTEDDEKVKQHFNKYLELEPDSPERESIESILSSL